VKTQTTSPEKFEEVCLYLQLRAKEKLFSYEKLNLASIPGNIRGVDDQRNHLVSLEREFNNNPKIITKSNSGRLLGTGASI
jgi:hypothetical protein